VRQRNVEKRQVAQHVFVLRGKILHRRRYLGILLKSRRATRVSISEPLPAGSMLAQM
jgi:hypothetical protein